MPPTDLRDAPNLPGPEELDGTYEPAGLPVPLRPRGPGDLPELEKRILAFERGWWRYAGAKEQAIRDTFGLSTTRYYQRLNRLLDEPAALVHDPVLVNRLRRLRTRRRLRPSGRS